MDSQTAEKIRQTADSLIELIESEAAEIPEGEREWIWKRLRKFVNEKLPPPPEIKEKQLWEPMDDEEAKEFEGEHVPYRAFATGEVETVFEVDIGTLIYFDTNYRFERQLNRYLRSQRGQNRQEHGQ